MALSPERLRALMSVGSADTIAFTRSNSPALIASMKAALLEVVSGMLRSYPGCGAPAGLNARTPFAVSAVARIVRSVLFAASTLVAATAGAQTGALPQEQPAWPSRERPPLGASFTVEPLGALPVSASIFPLLTSVAEVIGDRIDTGGISAGSPARVGAHGSSWTQTTYRVGDADITNLSGTGTPLLMPGVDVWERVDVTTGMMPIDINAPAMEVTLLPRGPNTSLLRTLELFGSPAFANAGSATTTPPSLTRLNSGARANLFVGGPIRDGLNALVSASWIRSSYSERDRTVAQIGTLANVFANVTSTPKAGDNIRVIAWAQRTSDAVAHHIVF